MRNKKVTFLLVITLALIAVLVVLKPYLASFLPKPSNISSKSPKPAQLELEYPYEVINVTDTEKEEVMKFVKMFETLQYDRKAREVLALFSPPVNSSEKKELDFLEGKDFGLTPRLYLTARFNCFLNWYVIRRIEKDNLGISVTLKELRTFHDNVTADYTAKTDDYTLVLSQKSNGEYQIAKYQYKGLPTKYSGLECN